MSRCWVLFPARFVARAVVGCVRSSSSVPASSPVVAAVRLALARSQRLVALASHSVASAPFPHFTLDTNPGGGIIADAEAQMSPSNNAMLLSFWARRPGVSVFHTHAAPTNAPPPFDRRRGPPLGKGETVARPKPGCAPLFRAQDSSTFLVQVGWKRRLYRQNGYMHSNDNRK